MEEKILPILRFDNFNDYWQKSSLLSQVEVRRGLTYKPNDVRSNGARVLRSSNIVDDSFVISDDDVFVSKDVINIPRVSNGDILVTAANGSTKLVGKHAIIKNLPDDEIVVHGGFMLLFKTEQNYFVNAWMSSNEYKRVLQFVQGGNGAIGNLSSTVLKSMKMSFPSVQEQSAIGSLFCTLDKLLASYKDNLANYQSLKTTMLSKMFPKAGQTVPEIRLDGFEGEWERLKMVEIFQIIDGDRGKSYPGENDFLSVGHTLFLDTGNVKKTGLDFSTTKFISEKKDKELRNGKLNLGDFILTSRGTLGNVAHYNENIQKRFSSVRINSAMLILRPLLGDKISPDYILAVLRGNLISDFMKVNQVGSAQPHITKKEFSKIKVLVPSNIREQQAIGAYFSNLDNLINFHQEKISQLETLKKKLLQDVFI